MTIDVDLKNAQAVFAVANTPLFLVRKLQEDPTVHALAHKLHGDDLLRELEMSVQQRPETIREAVIPYVCMVALSLYPDASYLSKSVSVQPKYQDDWFDYIRTALIQLYRSTQIQTVKVPAHVRGPRPMLQTNSASKYEVIQLGGVK
jgi:hypothetical protein